MIRKILILLVISIFFWITTSVALADIGEGESCDPKGGEKCISGFSCQLGPPPGGVGPSTYFCQRDVFGKIKLPGPLADLLKTDPTGAGAISQFLSNLVILIYSVATIALIFMLLWGAFEWLTSGGDKEKLSSAQKRIINAFIGIILFAVAFAVIRVLGVFTGFTFFK